MTYVEPLHLKYIEAPEQYGEIKQKTLFLAGGITNCPDWQKEFYGTLDNIFVFVPKNQHIAVFNPRRENFPIDNPNAAEEQITWEHQALRDADAISFWFCKETICPIVLYELGAWSMTDKPIFVGMDAEYQRRQDVEIQTKLVRPEIEIVYSLKDLGNQVKNHFQEYPMTNFLLGI